MLDEEMVKWVKSFLARPKGRANPGRSVRMRGIRPDVRLRHSREDAYCARRSQRYRRPKPGCLGSLVARAAQAGIRSERPAPFVAWGDSRSPIGTQGDKPAGSPYFASAAATGRNPFPTRWSIRNQDRSTRLNGCKNMNYLKHWLRSLTPAGRSAMRALS